MTWWNWICLKEKRNLAIWTLRRVDFLSCLACETRLLTFSPFLCIEDGFKLRSFREPSGDRLLCTHGTDMAHSAPIFLETEKNPDVWNPLRSPCDGCIGRCFLQLSKLRQPRTGSQRRLSIEDLVWSSKNFLKHQETARNDLQRQ